MAGRRKSWPEELHSYLGGVLRNKKAKLVAAGGIEDHMHVLASLPATVTLAEIAGALKANSSRWIHETIPQARDWNGKRATQHFRSASLRRSVSNSTLSIRRSTIAAGDSRKSLRLSCCTF
jgi:REP element-mobilizing transposase RayT